MHFAGDLVAGAVVVLERAASMVAQIFFGRLF